MGPGDLRNILSILPEVSNPDILVDMSYSDDAGIIRLTDDIALVQTVDFFTPIVDDPYDFGRIAAANAFSDVYAMGGQPFTAMNIVCFPSDDLNQDILKQTLTGGHDIIKEAGAFLMGGHSVDDQEFKYGLSVTGIIHPDKIISNSGAHPGDSCILTKPLGTGILATAIKGQIADQSVVKKLVDLTSTLNNVASHIMNSFPVSACTDITGFGLAGHACEIAKASSISIHFKSDQIPLIPQSIEYANMGLIPAGAYANKSYFQKNVHIAQDIQRVYEDLFFDPQTSGGLLICLPSAFANQVIMALKSNHIDAAIVGKVDEKGHDPFYVYFE